MKKLQFLPRLCRAGLGWLILAMLSACTAFAEKSPAQSTAPFTPNPSLTAAEGKRLRPSATSAPAPTPSPLLSRTSVSPCNNPYYPARLGAKWEYQLSNDVNEPFTRTILEETADGFVERDSRASEVIRLGRWQCRDGALTYLTALPYTAVVFAEMEEIEFTVESSEGVTLPAHPQPGERWTQKVVLNGGQNLEDEILELRAEVQYDCTAEAVEKINVPAGTFDTLRVNCRINITFTYPADAVNITLEIQSKRWWSAGTGMVRQVDEIEGQTSTIELLAYSLPE
ncbi:hypothetical protein [Anaerolinea sp.]|uniref:TapB family protein n=1 Tax=Anaerolinea sp. TaxID=1872519 RepID=UPI002ACDECAA|nr:hypothetical protein [Anaerolinea sp.]